MPRVAREAFSGFGHEAGSYAELAAQGLDDVSETVVSSSENVDGLSDSTDLKSPALSAICLISPNSRAWCNHEFGFYVE